MCVQAAASEASTRETALCEEKTALKTALSDQLAQRERDAAALAVALRQAAQRGDEITQLKHQVCVCVRARKCVCVCVHAYAMSHNNACALCLSSGHRSAL